MPRFVEVHGKTELESWESQRDAQRYHPAHDFVFQYWNKEYRVTLPCGESDRFRMYRIGTDLFCVSYNQRMDYVGVTRWTWDKGQFEESGNIFCSSAEHYEEYLGKDGLDKLSDRTIARRMIRVLDEVYC